MACKVFFALTFFFLGALFGMLAMALCTVAKHYDNECSKMGCPVKE